MTSDREFNQLRTGLSWLAAAALASSCQCMADPEPRTAVALQVVLDGSVRASERCWELAARVNGVLTLPGVRRLEVAAVQTGDHSVGYEPITLVPWRSWEMKAGLYASKDKLASARDAWVARLQRDCEANTRPVNVSAIVTAAERAALSLRSHCSELEQRRIRCSERMLAIHSDLRENADPRTARALGAPTRHRSPSKDSTKAGDLNLPTIDMGGLDVRVCGIAATAVGRHEKPVDPAVVTSIWKAILGVDADRFDPICSLGATTTGRL